MRARAGVDPIRVLVAKCGLDGHDRGALVVASALRDAGMEVIYTGIRQSPEAVARVAVQEDVDAVGLSSLSGAHMTVLPRVARALAEAGAERVLLFCGGVIPTEDQGALREAGFRGIFGPGTPTAEVVAFVRREAREP
ncbi:MAG: cobalamin B12-binding domain-containing protein [Planctomycetes bacterium]|nr:cobalamin B12-binding domain-containing protein [Planctomycetota bacterium]